MNKLPYKAYKMVPMIVVMGTIFFLSHKSGDEIHLPSFVYSDLVAHTMVYAALGCAVLFAWSDRFRKYNPLKVHLCTVAFCLLYGISDEFHQSFIPGRYVSAMDVVADTVGAILACTVWWFYSRKSVGNRVLS
ncbi:MAG: VanZ family protein [Desulforhopalus sp.]|jgi:VanZ family protein